MFAGWKARRQEARRAAALAGFEATDDREHRHELVFSLIAEEDAECALPLLLRLLDEEPHPGDRLPLVDTLTTALRNDRALLAEAEALLRTAGDRPRPLLDGWHRWRREAAERIGDRYEAPRPRDTDELLADLGWEQRALIAAGVVPRSALADEAVEPPIEEVAAALGTLSATVNQHAVRPGSGEPERRAEVRALLTEAAAAPPGTPAREEILERLLRDTSGLTTRWSDRREVDLALDEVLAHPDPELLAEALAVLLTADSFGRLGQLRETLARLADDRVRTTTATRVAVVRCYGLLALSGRLADAPYARIRALLDDPEPDVRAVAATHLDSLATTEAEEADAVRELTRLLGTDPVDGVRVDAARSLGMMVPSDTELARAVGHALGDHGGDPVPEIRVEYFRFVLTRHHHEVLPDFLEELADPEVSATHVGLVVDLDCADFDGDCGALWWWDHVDHYVHAGEVRDRLTALEAGGWAELPDPYATAEQRADLLALALGTVRQALGEDPAADREPG